MFLKKLQTVKAVYENEGIKGIARGILQKYLKAKYKNNKTSISNDKNPVSNIWEEYINWVTFANAGILERGNVFCFDYAIKNLPCDAPILEIGSFCGLSTNLITHFKAKHHVKNLFFTCDKWIFEGSEKSDFLGDSLITHKEYRDFIKETFLRNIKMFSRNDLPYTIELLSDEFFSLWKESKSEEDVFGRSVQLGGALSFCYIDGNHSYEYCRRDFDNCDKLLVSKGFILFDDSADGSGWDVCKVVKEVLKSGRYTVIKKNPNYLFQKK